MSEARYGLRQDRDGTWIIVDLLTCLPAASNGRDLAGLDHEDARDIMLVLNRDHLSKRKSMLV